MTINAVLRVPPASASDARAHFAAQFAFYTDVSDVHAALQLPEPGFVLLDTRGHAGWAQGRIPGALHLPTDEIPARAPTELDPAVPVVAYCWSPACNGAARAALALAGLGYRVKELLGGVEYWIREGFAVQTDAGLVRRPADPLTVPVAELVAVSPSGCAC